MTQTATAVPGQGNYDSMKNSNAIDTGVLPVLERELVKHTSESEFVLK